MFLIDARIVGALARGRSANSLRKVVGGVFGECCNDFVWISFHRMQISSYEKQYAASDCACSSNSAFPAVHDSLYPSPYCPALRPNGAAVKLRVHQRPAIDEMCKRASALTAHNG
jgi:hypothetical protein